MSYLKIKLPNRIRQNWLAIADHLESAEIQGHFSNRLFCSYKNGVIVSLNHYRDKRATDKKLFIRNLVGFGPEAGVRVPKGCPDWPTYMYAQLIPQDVVNHHLLKEFLVNREWRRIDDSMTSAIRRIRTAMNSGVPRNQLPHRVLANNPIRWRKRVKR